MKWIYMPDFARFANGAEVRKPSSKESYDSMAVFQTVTGTIKVGPCVGFDNVLRWAIVDSVDHFFRTATADDVGRMAHVSYDGFFRSKIIACESRKEGTEHVFVVERGGRPEYVPMASVFVEVDQPVAEVNPMTEGYDLTAKRIKVYEAIKEAGFCLEAIIGKGPTIERSAVYEVIHAVFGIDNQIQDVTYRFLDAVMGAVRPLCNPTSVLNAPGWVPGESLERSLKSHGCTMPAHSSIWDLLRMILGDGYDRNVTVMLQKLGQVYVNELRWRSRAELDADGNFNGPSVAEVAAKEMNEYSETKAKMREVEEKRWFTLVDDLTPAVPSSHIDAKEFGRNMGFGLPVFKDQAETLNDRRRRQGFDPLPGVEGEFKIVADPSMKPGEFILANADGDGAKVQERDILTRGDSWDKPSEQVGKRPSMVVIDDPARPIENIEQAIAMAGVWMKCADGRMRRIYEVDESDSELRIKWAFVEKGDSHDRAMHTEETMRVDQWVDNTSWFPATIHDWVANDRPVVRKNRKQRIIADCPIKPNRHEQGYPKPGPNRKPRWFRGAMKEAERGDCQQFIVDNRKNDNALAKRFIRVHNEYGQPLTGQWISDDSDAGKLVLPELTPEMLADSDQWSCQDTYLVVDPKNPLVGWVSIVIPEHQYANADTFGLRQSIAWQSE